MRDIVDAESQSADDERFMLGFMQGGHEIAAPFAPIGGEVPRPDEGYRFEAVEQVLDRRFGTDVQPQRPVGAFQQQLRISRVAEPDEMAVDSLHTLEFPGRLRQGAAVDLLRQLRPGMHQFADLSGRRIEDRRGGAEIVQQL